VLQESARVYQDDHSGELKTIIHETRSDERFPITRITGICEKNFTPFAESGIGQIVNAHWRVLADFNFIHYRDNRSSRTRMRVQSSRITHAGDRGETERKERRWNILIVARGVGGIPPEPEERVAIGRVDLSAIANRVEPPGASDARPRMQMRIRVQKACSSSSSSSSSSSGASRVYSSALQ